MSQVKIVTDSNTYFPNPDLIAQLGIEVIPLTVHVGQKTYGERVNATDEDFLRRLAQDAKLASVGAPSPGQMRGLFNRLSQTTSEIVCVHVSGALNDVAEVAREAAKDFIGRQRIVVIDTATTSVGVGLIVEAAGRAAAEGAPITEVVRIVRGMIPHMYALLFSDSLEFLEAWGRLGAAQTLLGTMLGLKPLSTMEDGDLLPVEKVRHYPRAVDKLYDFIIEFSHIEQMFLLQHGFEIEAAQLLERLEVVYLRREFPVIGYPPSLAVHIGPKALGVIVYEGER
ncbi:MAG: DegV family protein [Chloroflexi bacterium]|nr:DegV family protein [Chloroflexota bacterium]